MPAARSAGCPANRRARRGSRTGARHPRSGENSRYRGARGLDPAVVAEIERAFGFDKPWQDRLWTMLAGYARFDLGRSLFRDKPVVDLILEKMPVSISLGLWSTLIIYLVSIPLGIRKAVRDGSRFDLWTSGGGAGGLCDPGLPLRHHAGGAVRGRQLPAVVPAARPAVAGDGRRALRARALDYAWHMVLPTIALVIGGFAGLTMLTKNSFLEEINKQYTVTARAKGAGETRVLYGHVFRNAMLLIIAGFPAAFIGILFTGALLVEIIFSLDGLGLLGFESAIRRDYPVMFGTLYIFTLLGLVMQIVGDFAYTLVDPRIDFEARR